MKFADNSWLFKPLFEYEYKSYQIMAFEQFLQNKFEGMQLYPYLHSVNYFLKNISIFEKSELQIKENFPLSIKGIDLENEELIYQALASDHQLDEFHSILQLAKSKLFRCKAQGEELLQKASRNIQISPIGLVDSSMAGGYLFFRKLRETRVYSYEFRLIKTHNERYKEVKTVYLNQEKTSTYTDYTDIKIRYVKSKKAKYGINAYLVETNTEFPHFETVMPVVKDYLIRLEDQ